MPELLKGFEFHRPVGHIEETGGFIPFKKYDESNARRALLHSRLEALQSARQDAYEEGKNEAEAVVLTMPWKRLFALIILRLRLFFRRR